MNNFDMSKKSKENLGRSLLRHKERAREVSSRHTTDFGSANTAISITENTSVEEFLSQAEAAQRSFQAERGRTDIVRHEGDVIEEEGEDSDGEEDDEEEDFCSIPKKPDWKGSETAEEYLQLEQDTFLKWRRRLNAMQRTRSNVPPFEKNLEFWRQLWKMVELSDVVVQVVDARDPLFYFNRDLAAYVGEVDPRKQCVMLVNKADLLTPSQREQWAKHLEAGDIRTIFFSAVEETSDAECKDEEELVLNTARVFSPPEVLLALQRASLFSPLTVGFVGYPNVGKSSTINRFLTNKRLQVSETPGKTKHYQTHLLSGSGNCEVRLVDGPGLVMPNLDMTKAEMVLGGILPIDNLTDFMPSMELLLSRIPSPVLLKHYGVLARHSQLAARQAGDGRSAGQGARVLSALAVMRGFMKPGGVPDQFKAAKIILKDYIHGKLLYCAAPPGVEQKEFCPYDDSEPLDQDDDMSLEESFPELSMSSGMHVRGKQGQNVRLSDKKHKKKEKARRLYQTPYAE